MIRILTLLLFAGFVSAASAQNYGFRQTTGTADPYAYNNSGATVLAIPSSDVLSSSQSIPFAWNFYGSQVFSYKVSDNGYITFDTGSSTSDPANTSIPDAGGPNHAIYAFWDDLELIADSGSADQVVSFSYGTAPCRTHVIQWSSVTPVSGSGFVYTAIRLHECGDFDIVHNYGSASGSSATVGCEDAKGLNGTMVQGPSYDFPALGSAGTDDMVYTFYWDGVRYDASITDTDLDSPVPIGYHTVSGKIVNGGSSAISSYTLHYTVDNGAAVTMKVSGANIPAFGGSDTYSHSTPLNLTKGGEIHRICVWADNINGNADQRPGNDQLCFEVSSNLNITASDVNIVVEQFTGTWCGWCPDGAVVLKDILDTYPDDAIGISIHDGDGMAYDEGIRSGFDVTAYPHGMVDRTLFDGQTKESHSRGAWVSNAAASLSKHTPVEVGISHTYDAGTRTITATVTADYVDYAFGDMRFVFAVTEDNVTGRGFGYDQTNYLDTTVGHPYQGAGNPIIGFNHRHVLRANPAGAFGNAGVIPSRVIPGGSYSETFSYVIPISYDENEISVIGFVNYVSTIVGKRSILNAAKKHLSDIDACSNNPCDPLASCTDLPAPAGNDGFICSCNAGYSGDGLPGNCIQLPEIIFDDGFESIAN